jgi:hypothetical protein
MDNQEKEFLDDVDTDIDTSFRKPKKQLSEQKLQHLQNIRVKALEKKKQMKEITEKANKLKEFESLKEAKKIQKEQLAKKYDEMIENAKPKEEEVKPKIEEVKPIVEEVKQEVKPKVEEVKPIKKKKVIKKIVYQEASSSDSDDADEVEEVVKVKKQSKNKIIPVDKPQPPQQNVNHSYSNLLYESSVDKLKSRMMDERARNLIMSVMPSYG